MMLLKAVVACVHADACICRSAAADVLREYPLCRRLWQLRSREMLCLGDQPQQPTAWRPS